MQRLASHLCNLVKCVGGFEYDSQGEAGQQRHDACCDQSPRGLFDWVCGYLGVDVNAGAIIGNIIAIISPDSIHQLIFVVITDMPLG